LSSSNSTGGRDDFGHRVPVLCYPLYLRVAEVLV